MTRPLAVVFDMDGLMFNTEEVYWQVGTELLGRRGHPFTKELNAAIMGRPPRVCFEIMIEWCGLSDSWETLQDESETLFIGLLDGRLAPLPGLLDLLDALESARMPKAICTSSSLKLLDAILSRFDMHARFEFILTSADITQGKPHPEIYQKAAARFGIEPGHMLVLEDSQNGCRSAAAAGAFVVAVPGEHSLDHDFGMTSLRIESLESEKLYEVLALAARP